MLRLYILKTKWLKTVVKKVVTLNLLSNVGNLVNVAIEGNTVYTMFFLIVTLVRFRHVKHLDLFGFKHHQARNYKESCLHSTSFLHPDLLHCFGFVSFCFNVLDSVK